MLRNWQNDRDVDDIYDNDDFFIVIDRTIQRRNPRSSAEFVGNFGNFDGGNFELLSNPAHGQKGLHPPGHWKSL